MNNEKPISPDELAKLSLAELNLLATLGHKQAAAEYAARMKKLWFNSP